MRSRFSAFIRFISNKPEKEHTHKKRIWIATSFCGCVHWLPKFWRWRIKKRRLADLMSLSKYLWQLQSDSDHFGFYRKTVSSFTLSQEEKPPDETSFQELFLKTMSILLRWLFQIAFCIQAFPLSLMISNQRFAKNKYIFCHFELKKCFLCERRRKQHFKPNRLTLIWYEISA